MPREYTRRPLLERFWEKVAVGGPDDCWLWTAGTDSRGYGQFNLEKSRPAKAHRMAYELSVGPIPPGLYICHLCEGRYPPGDITGRGCVNPAHLRPGTAQENQRMLAESGRGRVPRVGCRGERHPLSVLTAIEVDRIRALHRHGDRTLGAEGLARRYGVSSRTIFNVVHRLSWTHRP